MNVRKYIIIILVPLVLVLAPVRPAAASIPLFYFGYSALLHVAAAVGSYLGLGSVDHTTGASSVTPVQVTGVNTSALTVNLVNAPSSVMALGPGQTPTSVMPSGTSSLLTTPYYPNYPSGNWAFQTAGSTIDGIAGVGGTYAYATNSNPTPTMAQAITSASSACYAWKSAAVTVYEIVNTGVGAGGGHIDYNCAIPYVGGSPSGTIPGILQTEGYSPVTEIAQVNQTSQGAVGSGSYVGTMTMPDGSVINIYDNGSNVPAADQPVNNPAVSSGANDLTSQNYVSGVQGPNGSMTYTSGYQIGFGTPTPVTGSLLGAGGSSGAGGGTYSMTGPGGGPVTIINPSENNLTMPGLPGNNTYDTTIGGTGYTMPTNNSISSLISGFIASNPATTVITTSGVTASGGICQTDTITIGGHAISLNFCPWQAFLQTIGTIIYQIATIRGVIYMFGATDL